MFFLRKKVAILVLQVSSVNIAAVASYAEYNLKPNWAANSRPPCCSFSVVVEVYVAKFLLPSSS